MLTLSQSQLEEIIDHAKKEYPNEACGILAGRAGKVLKVFKMVNIDRSSTTYFMDPKQQFKVMKELREKNLELLAIYHSHVATEAYPSARDVELAFYPEALYLIISLKNLDRPEIRAFEIRNGEIQEEAIKVRKKVGK